MILIETNDLSIADGWHTEYEGVQTIKIRFLWLMKHGFSVMYTLVDKTT